MCYKVLFFLSSAKVNWGKSEAIWVGEWEKRCTGLSGGLVWKKEGFKLVLSVKRVILHFFLSRD